MELQIPVSLIELFKLIGSPIFVGFMISLFAEKVPAFHALSSTAKFAAIMAMCAVASLLSYALVNYVPSNLIERIQPLYAQVATLVLAIIGSQVWNQIFNQAPTVITTTATSVDGVAKESTTSVSTATNIPANANTQDVSKAVDTVRAQQDVVAGTLPVPPLDESAKG